MILGDLTREEMALVEQVGCPRQICRGEWILSEGETGNSFFLILSGRVEVRKSIGLDKYRKLVELGPLDIFGEVCFLGVENRSAGVIAIEDAVLMEFQRAAFEQMMSRHPVVGMKVYRAMAGELVQRLARVDGDLRDALLWAMGDVRTPVDPNRIALPKLQLLSAPTAGGRRGR